MVALLIRADLPGRGVGLPPFDAHDALEDHEQRVADLTFGDDRRATCEVALVRDGGDPLQVLGVEPFEERNAPKLEHPLDLAEAGVRAGHRPSVAPPPL